jgi:N-acetylglutamate synthase-like GNAT family acetyltransferase
MSEQERQVRRIADRLDQPKTEKSDPAGTGIEIRRARRGDVPGIATLVRQATQGKRPVDEAEVLDWLFGKGLLVAARGANDVRVVGVATWQAENLLSVTDLFYVYPAKLRAEAGGRLLAAIEVEANVLMCEANVVILPPHTSKAVRSFLNKQGYESKMYQELHRIWREVLGEFVADQPELMVKRLREKMIMAPI